MKKDIYHGPPVQFDPFRVARVLSEILSRERGYPVEIVLTPKVPVEKPPQAAGA